MSEKAKFTKGLVLAAACLLIVAVYAGLANLKGIGTDEGFRLGIINGGKVFTAEVPGTDATWADVLRTNQPYAYQPLYFLVLNTVMRAGHTHDDFALKCVNVFFLWLALQGLLALARPWPLLPQLFLLGLFAGNAYLLMHVLQLREYIVAIAFYVWSTWLALHLDRRPLARAWADAGWFAAYGGLLALGFYTSTWAVMPAVAQGLFLVFRRAGQRWRFYANLALSYAVVISLTLPYLQVHHEKVNIGRWGSPGTTLWPWLGDGFHYVLSGHYYGQRFWAELVFWSWLGLLAAGVALFAGRTWRTVAPESRREAGRQGWLMLLCLAVAVAFQVGYYLKVDSLSVWPRYFALHYFFLLWLVALAFLALYEVATTAALPALGQRRWRIATRTTFGVMLVSTFLQVRSYWVNPYLDCGLSRESNWRVISAGLAREVKPGDAVLMQDFLQAWTLTFTRAMPQRVLYVYPPNLDSNSVVGVQRIVYLEHEGNVPARAGIATSLAALGFGPPREEGLPAADATRTVPAWRILIFPKR